MSYVKVVDYTFEHAARSAARLGIPSTIDAEGITFDLSEEPAISEDSCFCSDAKSARAYLRQVRIIRHMHTDNERSDEEARIEAMSQHWQDWRATERDYPELLPW
jgi:hypothetical protein